MSDTFKWNRHSFSHNCTIDEFFVESLLTLYSFHQSYILTDCFQILFILSWDKLFPINFIEFGMLLQSDRILACTYYHTKYFSLLTFTLYHFIYYTEGYVDWKLSNWLLTLWLALQIFLSLATQNRKTVVFSFIG